MLSGADNVELWTEQWIWDDLLKGIDFVISTHQVFLDALIHGFVRMEQLALLVFDEGTQIPPCLFNPSFVDIATLSPFVHGQPPIKQNTAGLFP